MSACRMGCDMIIIPHSQLDHYTVMTLTPPSMAYHRPIDHQSHNRPIISRYCTCTDSGTDTGAGASCGWYWSNASVRLYALIQ